MSDQPKLYRSFDEMCWPVPGKRLDDLIGLLHHASKDTVLTMSERVSIASVLQCYAALIGKPEKVRNRIIRELRKGPT